ncbi:hypothetical protein Pmani_016958 [Petrolisthes manimaculis]|uniref:Serine/threonine-protein kinase 11-interacting protein n=1 Tax=Petrolisthes manimaculis TaxID=1843537 RepID=A0AAE1PR58_9EUCA|nr:hypothetical protein Pmani_016958 [Petrolisthes manimaculis]
MSLIPMLSTVIHVPEQNKATECVSEPLYLHHVSNTSLIRSNPCTRARRGYVREAVMDDASLQRVCGLAASLRHSAHLLLDKKHKLSLDTWTLGEVVAAFSLILEVEQHTNFHVLPLNHRLHPAIPHLQFVYDLLQKIPGLRLWAKEGQIIPPECVPLSVRCFRSVLCLEVSHVPISSIKALQTLRPSLRSITVVRGVTSLAELFVQCGADNAGEFAWESLHEAVLSHNTLHSLDSSLALLTNLKVLDLSHCELRDASALNHLPCVTFLDLSHNQLTSLPPLSPSAATSLTLLTINNNFITQLAGLEEMSNLEELDVQGNLLSFLGVLGVLGALPHLRVLTLTDNPLVFHPSYRTRVITMLNPATANKEMILDGEPLSTQEHNSVGTSAVVTSFSYSTELLTSLSALPTPVHATLPTPTSPSQPVFSLGLPETEGLRADSIDSQPPSLVQGSFTSLSRSAGDGPTRKRSKKKRTRHIAIADPDGDKDGEGSGDNGGEAGLDSLMASSMEALPQPPPPSLVAPSSLQPSGTLEDTINFAALALKAGMSSPGAEQSDRLLEEILQSKPQSGTMASTVTPPPSLVTDTQNPNKESGENNTVNKREETTRPEENEEREEERIRSEERLQPLALTEPTSPETSFYHRAANISQESSINASPDSSDSEGEDDKSSEVHRVLAQREVVEVEEQEQEEEEQGTTSLHDVILAITDTHFKEKHGITTRTLFRWDLVTLESAETLSSDTPDLRLRLTFNTIRPAYKTRTYCLAQEDYQSLDAVLSPVLERNTLKAVLHSAMECLRCHAQFSQDLARPTQGCDALRCPNCGGGVVVRVDGVDHPAITSSTPINYSPALQDSPPRNTQTVMTGVAEGQGESSESVSVCSDVSARRESDVEVISNPSISSIEVLAEQLIIQDIIPEDDRSGGGGRGVVRGLFLGPPPPAAVNSDARTPPLAPSPTTPHTHHQDHHTSANMQESSSSGSMSGSICTTYERPGSLPTSPLRHPAPQPNTHQAPNTSADALSDSSSNVLYQTAESSLEGEMLNCTSNTNITITTSTPTITTTASATTMAASPHASPSASPVLSSSCTSIDTVKNGNTGNSELPRNRTSTTENVKSMHNKGVMTSMREEGEDKEQQQRQGEKGEGHNLASWVQSLLHTLTGYYWVWWEEVPEAEGKVERASNPILYSYEDFARVDHRLKLHCDVVLFHEQREELLGLVKAVLLVKGGRREFQGLMVVSTKKLYVLEIVGSEDDSPQSWLELQSSHSLNEVSSLHSLYQRQGLALSLPDSLILVSLADSHRANCLFNFLSEVLDEHGISPNIEESSPAQEEALTKLVMEAVGGSVAAATPSVFAIVSILMDGGCSESQFLVVTETDLVLFHANLNWYLPPSPPSEHLLLSLNHIQKIANITAIEVGSASHIGLQFLDEVSREESTWDLHVASPVAACHIIQAIRTPWSHLFSVDLQEFIGVYRSQEGDVLTVTRLNVDEDEDAVHSTPTPTPTTTTTTTSMSGEDSLYSYTTEEVKQKRDEEIKYKLGMATDLSSDTQMTQPEDWTFDSYSQPKESEEGEQRIDISDENRWEVGKKMADAGIWKEERREEGNQRTDDDNGEEAKNKRKMIYTGEEEKHEKRKERRKEGKEPLEDDEWYQVAAISTKMKYDPKYPILGYSDQQIPTLVLSEEKGDV